MYSYERYLTMIVIYGVLRGTMSRPLIALLEHTEPYFSSRTPYGVLSASLVTEPKFFREQDMLSTYPVKQGEQVSKAPVPMQAEMRDAVESSSRTNSNHVLPKHGGVFEMELGDDFAGSTAWREVEKEPHVHGVTDRYESYGRNYDEKSPPTSPRSFFLSLGSSHNSREAQEARGARLLQDSSKLDHKDAIRIDTRGDARLRRVWT